MSWERGSRASSNDGSVVSLARMMAEASSASGSRSQRMTVDELRRLADHANKSGLESKTVPYQELRWDPGVMEEAAAVKREQLAAITANIRRPSSKTGSPLRARGANSPDVGQEGQYLGPRLSGAGTAMHRLVRQSSSLLTAGRGSRNDMPFNDLTRTVELTRPRRWVVRGDQPAKVVWDGVVSLVLIFCYVSAPLLGAFYATAAPLRAGWHSAHACIDALLLCDMLLAGCTSYLDPRIGATITDPARIFASYARGALTPNLIAVLPIDWLLLSGGGEERRILACFVRLFKALPRLPSLLRTMRVGADNSINPLVVLLAKLSLCLGFVWHWIACAYSLLYWMGSQDACAECRGWLSWEPDTESDGADVLLGEPSDEPWAAAAAAHSTWGPPRLGAAPVVVRYAYALHWAIAASSQTFHPVPTTLPQQMMALCTSMVGVIIVAVSVGAATTILGELHSQSSESANRLRRIHRLLVAKHVAPSLRRRIISYVSFHDASLQQLDDAALGKLPLSLKIQLDLATHRQVFVQLRIFRACGVEEVLAIVQRLKPMLALPGDILVKQGERPIGMHVLMKGVVHVTTDDTLVLRRLHAVTSFGEATLVGEQGPTVAGISPGTKVTVAAVTYCELTVLLWRDFQHGASEYPSLLQHVHIYLKTKEREEKWREERWRQQTADAEGGGRGGGGRGRLGSFRGSIALSSSFRAAGGRGGVGSTVSKMRRRTIGATIGGRSGVAPAHWDLGRSVSFEKGRGAAGTAAGNGSVSPRSRRASEGGVSAGSVQGSSFSKGSFSKGGGGGNCGMRRAQSFGALDAAGQRGSASPPTSPSKPDAGVGSPVILPTTLPAVVADTGADHDGFAIDSQLHS